MGKVSAKQAEGVYGFPQLLLKNLKKREGQPQWALLLPYGIPVFDDMAGSGPFVNGPC